MKKLLILLAAFMMFNCSNKQDEIKKLSENGVESIPAIAKYLEDPDMAVRKEATKTLGEIGTEQSLVFLKQCRDNAKQKEEMLFVNEIMKKVKDNMAPKKPTFVPRPVNENDPLQTQVSNYVYNFMFKGGVGYGPKDEMELEVKGATVINYTDMTEFYENTLRIKDWKTFYEYIKRTVLGYPTGDITAEIFKKFPQLTTFKQIAYVGEEPTTKDGVTVYAKKRTIGKAEISQASFKKIDGDTKEYLDKLSVSQQHFAEFEDEVGKFIKGVWYDKTIENKAKAQVSGGTE